MKMKMLLIIYALLFIVLTRLPAFAGQMLLPSFPDLPSGEKMYDAGGASPEQAQEIDDLGRPAEKQGELKVDGDDIKPNRFKIEYDRRTLRIEPRMLERKPFMEDEPGNGASPTSADIAAHTYPALQELGRHRPRLYWIGLDNMDEPRDYSSPRRNIP